MQVLQVENLMRILNVQIPDTVFQKMQRVFRNFRPVVTHLFASHLNYKIFPYVNWIPWLILFTCWCLCYVLATTLFILCQSPFQHPARCPSQSTTEKSLSSTGVSSVAKPDLVFKTTGATDNQHSVTSSRSTTIFYHWHPTVTHPLKKHFRLCSAIVSGNTSKIKSFWNQLPNLPQQHFSLVLREIMEHAFINGMSFAPNGKLIQALPL